MNNQGAKADAGKLPLTLVPLEIIRNIAAVRRYGKNKYGSSENWKTIEPERYRDALFRHLLLYIEDPCGVDEESGLPHLWHLACNVAFLCELQKNELKPRQDGVNLKDIKCLNLSNATEEEASTISDMMKNSKTAINCIDADDFDWSKCDYTPDYMAKAVEKQQQVADKFKDTNGLVDEF